MNRRILVVEDDPSIRATLAEVLAEEGHTVVCAENGSIGLSRLRSMDPPPDVIFLDLMMPVKDGFEFRAEQRAGAHADIPVVVMSADSRMVARREELAARCYLRKPFDLNALLEAAAT